jgi:hypothetical protein
MPSMGRAGACALAAAFAAAVAASLGAAVSAAASSRRVHDEGYLHYIRSSGSQVIDEGRAHGTLPGHARVRFTYNGEPTVHASFTIQGRGWSISGHGSGRLSNPNSSAPSFRGKLTLSGGSGRYAHARGSGELFGVFYRHSYALTFQAIGTLHY